MSRTMNEAKISIDFKPSIDAYAKAHHLDLSTEAADSLAETLAAVVQIDEDNRVAFVIGNDRTGDITQALDIYSAGTPRKTKASSSAPAGNTATAKAMAKVYEARAGQAAAAAQAAAVGGNPWSAATFSRTAQAIITNTDPQLATRLRAQAGARA